MPYFTFSTLTEKESNPSLAPQMEEGSDGSIDTLPDNQPESRDVGEARQIDSHEGFIFRTLRTLRQLTQAAHPKIETPHNSSESSSPQLSLIAEAETYQNLFKAYRHRGSIIHGSRTLDEFFYHSLTDTEVQADLEVRNKDQVTTKRIRHAIKHGGGHGDWTIIRVDQLWLWIVDNSKHACSVLDAART